jgi:hypothetical protein
VLITRLKPDARILSPAVFIIANHGAAIGSHFVHAAGSTVVSKTNYNQKYDDEVLKRLGVHGSRTPVHSVYCNRGFMSFKSQSLSGFEGIRKEV